MRVLHLPVNYGSLPSHSVRCLQASGVDAYGLVFTNTVHQSADGLKSVYGNHPRTSPRYVTSRLHWMTEVVRALAFSKPDILHWYFGREALPLGLDLALVKALKLPGVVEWQGSDIRIPEQEAAENPYYAAALQQGYEYLSVESRETSLGRQRRFAEAGFASCAPVGMLQYIQSDIFPHTYTIPQRFIVDDYVPAYPDHAKRIPLVVHSPSAPVAKGTQAVLKAVEQLQGKVEFEFRLVHGMPRPQALELVRQADIFLDQFVYGDRGMAALEAMALGKPVICWIKPQLVPLYPADDPLVNASQDTLADTLEALLRDGERRHVLGRQGRAFVEREYHIPTVAGALVDMYTDVIQRHRH